MRSSVSLARVFQKTLLMTKCHLNSFVQMKKLFGSPIGRLVRTGSSNQLRKVRHCYYSNSSNSNNVNGTGNGNAKDVQLYMGTMTFGWSQASEEVGVPEASTLLPTHLHYIFT